MKKILYKIKRMNTSSKMKIIAIAIVCFIAILSFFVLPLKDGKTFFYAMIHRHDLYDSLSQDRQALYDKMKIEYVNIKSRTTGTAPFNTDAASNANGVDISDKDDYIRTFDVMKYTIELGVIPNTSVAGVTGNSNFIGGVIKVRAKLPNQGSPTLMRWDKDAWMQNVSITEDGTVIYAEYHVSDGVSVTNGNQNLTFTVKVDGYKKDVTAAMAPEFEVWMEGNKPDNSSSAAASIMKKDNRNIIISGHESFDIQLGSSGYLNIKDRRTLDGKEVNGQLLNYSVAVALYQDVPEFSDMRGICYPSTEVFDIDLKLDYSYRDIGENGPWVKLNGTDPKAYDIVNKTKVIAYGLNRENKEGYYPVSQYVYGNSSYPTGRLDLGSSYNSVQDSGTMTLTQNNENIKMTFKNFVLNGKYPDRCWGCTFEQASYQRNGYFLSGVFEVFAPYYDDGGASYDYQVGVQAESAYVKALNGSAINLAKNGDYVSDKVQSNNRVVNTVKNYLSGSAWGLTRSYDSNYRNSLDNYYYYGNGSLIKGGEFTMYAVQRIYDGPYEGGADGLLAWNTNFFKVKSWDGSSEFTFGEGSVNGYSPASGENVKGYFGVLKSNPNGGLTTNEQVNGAVYNDFNWYSTIAEAESHGKVAAFYFNNPDLRGFTQEASFGLRFNAVDDFNNIGSIGIFRYKWKFYGDAARTNVYYYGGEAKYNSNSGYQPTIYKDDGTVESYESSENYGETVLIIGELSSVTTSVSDKDSQGNLKSAYDVQDSTINIVVTPSLVNGAAPRETDPVNSLVVVKSILPEGLSYVNGSANKTPKSVIQNADGTTTITWEYQNWQQNHPAPGFPKITYRAEISASLENNQQLEIKSTIKSEGDLRDEDRFRTGKYGVIISNLSGSRAGKIINKSYLEPNESFVVSSVLGNNNEEPLQNVRSIEILPRTGDENGSNYHGNFTMKVNSLPTGLTLYYTTNPIDNIGLTTDRYGKIMVKNVNFGNDSRWIQVGVNGTIPANATAIASVLGELPAKSEVKFDIQYNPANNRKADIYAFSLNMTSNNLQQAVKSNVVVTKVIERKISGIVFEDRNNDNIYKASDKTIEGLKVELLDSNFNKIDETTTDGLGYYEFSLPGSGKYFVRFESKFGYDMVTKGTADNASKTNINYITDQIDHTYKASQAVEMIGNINMGIRKKEAHLRVKFIDIETNKPIIPDEYSTVYYTDEYTTESSSDIPSYYNFVKTTGDPVTGTIQKDNYEVIYYYILKPAKIITHHYIEGTDHEKLADDVTKDTQYTKSYTTQQIDTTNLDYELSTTDGDPVSGTVEKDEYHVNYYYKLKKGTVITHHLLWEDGPTDTVLSPDVSKVYTYRDIYDTEKAELTRNYELYKKSENYTGVVKQPEINVYYYYQLKDSKVETSVVKEGTRGITKPDEKVEYTVIYNASIQEYIGDGTITIVDTLPYKLDVNKSDLEGGTYDSSKNTITWIEPWNNINTYEEQNETARIEIIKNLQLVYSDLNPRDRLMVNSVKGTLELSNNKRDIEGQTSTTIEIPGKITVKYLNKETGEPLAEEDVTTDLVGEPYTSKAKDIPGWEVVTMPDTETYEYEVEDQEVIYEYSKIVLKVETKVLGEGGTISGDEDVIYGDDSTKDYIIIQADQGFVIEKILINGVPVDIGIGEEGVVLNNFLIMQENKLVEVSFMQKPAPNPNTKGSIITALIVTSFLIGIFFGIKTKFFKKIFKINKYE